MATNKQPLRSCWFEFLGSLRTQLRAAFVVGLPADRAVRSGDLDTNGDGEALVANTWFSSGDVRRRYLDDSPGYITRNGRGSLEVGAFRDRSSD